MISPSTAPPLALPPVPAARPLVVSLCGTFLKPEMQSLYRQILGLRAYRTVVYTEKRQHPDLFPFEPVVTMKKTPWTDHPAKTSRSGAPRRRPRGNFLRRFYYKHLLKQWPPPPRPVRPGTLLPAPVPELVYRPPYNLIDLLQTHQPALAHVYYGHKAVKYLPMIRRWGGPMVVSFHGVDTTDAVYRSGAAQALPPVFAYARLVLARSQSLLDRLAILGCAPDKLRLNRAAIPTEHLPTLLRRPPPDGDWRLLQACRLIAKKGVFTTLQAFAEVVRRWPRARLTIAGDGPLAGEIQREATGLGLADQVTMTGWCSQDQLRALYAEAHVFLHPSERTEADDQEGIPNSLLEAMATGLPVVTTAHGGIPEAVAHEVDGLLVPEKDPAALAVAVLRLLGSESLFTTLSEGASGRVARQFSLSRQVELLEACYHEAAAPAVDLFP